MGARVDSACVAVVGRAGNEPPQEPPTRTRALTLVWLFAFGLAALGTGDTLSASRHKDIRTHRSKAAAAAGHKRGTALDAKRHTAALQSEESDEAVARVPLPIERPAGASLPTDLSVAKQAIELIRKSKLKDAAALAASISDPVAHKLIEWALLRSSDSPAGFERYAAFLGANPDWPGALLRRRAEARLWQERHDGTTVRRFVGKEPASSVGRLALARVLMNEGDRDGAAREVRAVWQSAELSAEMEFRRSRHVYRHAEPRRRCRAHGPTPRRQGFWRCDARCKTRRRRSSCDREGMHRRRGEIRQGRSIA